MLKNLEWQTFRVDTTLGQCVILMVTMTTMVMMIVMTLHSTVEDENIVEDEKYWGMKKLEEDENIGEVEKY